MYNPCNQEYKYDRIGTFYATWKCSECTITSTKSELSIDFNRKEILEMVMENKDLENIKWN